VTRLSISVMLHAPAGTGAAEICSYAHHVERLGLDAVFAGDHLTPSTPILDSTVTLAAVAAATERIQIGFGVMVVALRHPAWTARQVSSLQQLSSNRVILGVGVGGAVHGTGAWEAVGVPYAERGPRTDATLRVLPDLIAGRPTHLDTGDITLGPGAAVPPIWIGGGSDASIRRTVAHGATWFPSMVPATYVARGARRLEELAAGRGRPTPRIAVGGGVLLGPKTPAIDAFIAGLTRGYGLPAEWAAAIPITGGAAQAAQRFAEYAGAGAEHLVLGVIGGDWREQCELIAEARTLLD
jgi:alkanesulfonate monooxygenase SsuD/methylene tetrahydromethanopterin reductase-like flavin-dependent oxidoreductase (luciferase family)